MSIEEDVWTAFRDSVNMAPKELEDWLGSEQSKDVGQKDGDAESTGHHSGRRIVEILRTKKADLSEDDAAHMSKVVGYVNRHSSQRPDKDGDELAATSWAASLKNWGHDPLKD